MKSPSPEGFQPYIDKNIGSSHSAKDEPESTEDEPTKDLIRLPKNSRDDLSKSPIFLDKADIPKGDPGRDEIIEASDTINDEEEVDKSDPFDVDDETATKKAAIARIPPSQI